MRTNQRISLIFFFLICDNRTKIIIDDHDTIQFKEPLFLLLVLHENQLIICFPLLKSAQRNSTIRFVRINS